MTEAKGPTTATATTNKLAMSRALGAAFLNHQVEQLEKSVNGPASGNWRDRRQGQSDRAHSNGRGPGAKRPPQTPGIKIVRKKGAEATERGDPLDRSRTPRTSEEDGGPDKDADVVVVDASVLVHALPQVKKWCNEGRQEILIVPLEALNTLDLLKKGTTVLAQKARAASRTLESQVGSNPRIRVQQDDAFVLWDSIPFKDLPADDKAAVNPQLHVGSSPEWVRRTICCARWELEHFGKEGKTSPKVVLAVLAPMPVQQPTHVPADAPTDATSPVPLPAPSTHGNKFEPRSAGTLVGQWAYRAGIDMLQIKPASQPPATNTAARSHHKLSSDEERPKKTHGHHGQVGGGRGRRSSHSTAPGSVSGSAPGSSGLVERPPAVMAMMEMVSQPKKVVRVLARGEKLDPDP